ncbi:hypothetical protein DMA12_46700 [Amycolatopsis balhimycina DSM 5908]|uniref:Helix-turn-helix domain-containing protein n=1 Tax=Amycolatopsis balhimycina DSM 5908 TaxID=1081091 RepID=A0A428VVM8_AMYBA|nr:hypothetical protein DMA12_46700 [Amycolatopsis balhimycina DSM 5908]
MARKAGLRRLPRPRVAPQPQPPGRLRAVAAVEAGQHPEEVAVTLGMARSTVFGWIAKYRDGGKQALKARSGGVPTGQPWPGHRAGAASLRPNQIHRDIRPHHPARWPGGQSQDSSRQSAA